MSSAVPSSDDHHARTHLGEHGAHRLERLHRNDTQLRRDEGPRQLAGTRRQVDDARTQLETEPVHGDRDRLVREARTASLVQLGVPAPSPGRPRINHLRPG